MVRTSVARERAGAAQNGLTVGFDTHVFGEKAAANDGNGVVVDTMQLYLADPAVGWPVWENLLDDEARTVGGGRADDTGHSCSSAGFSVSP